MEPEFDTPDAQTMQRIAERVIAALPARFGEHLRRVVLRVEDFATPEQLASVDLEDRWQLSGLYEGVLSLIHI